VKKNTKQTLKNRSRIDVARQLSTSGKHAGAWLRCLPRGEFRMTDSEFQTACLFRLGCKFPFIPDTLRCTCGSKKNSSPLVGQYGEHLHSCNLGNERHNKHNSLVQIFSHLCNYAGIKTITEPTGCFSNSNSNQRPDLRLLQPGFSKDCRHDTVVDVTVTHPATTAKITHNNTDKNIGRAAYLSEMSKRREYAEMSKQNNLHFVPLAFETYGRWGKELISFFEKNVMTGWRKSGQCTPLAVMKEYWKKRLSVNLQVMNARMFLQRVTRIIRYKESNNGGKVDESAFSDTFKNSWVHREDCRF